MEQWNYPITQQDQTAFNEGLLIEQYRQGRDTPAPYIAPPPVVVEEKQEAPIIRARHIKGIAYAGAGLAVAYSMVAFVAAYAVQIGAVAGAVVLVSIVVGGLNKSDSGANVRTTKGTIEAKQTIINIHVAADGGRVDVNK